MSDDKKLSLVDSGKCEVCQDTGYAIVEDERGGTMAVRCKCRESKRDALAEAGLEKRERSYTVQGLNGAQRRLIDDARHILAAGDSLLIRGEVGRGKTGLAVVLLREASAAGRKIAWCHVATWLKRIKRSFDEAQHPEVGRVLDEDDLTNPLVTADLLAIDDLGAEYLTPWTRSMVYSLVDQCESRQTQVICTTNLPLASPDSPSITSVYGDRVASRLSRYRRLTLPSEAPDRRAER